MQALRRTVCAIQSRTANAFAAARLYSSIYDFQVNGADHQPYDLAQHKGNPLLIYNVASQCGFAKGGYEAATTLYNKYKDQGFTVLAFPCNQFGGQEPGKEEEIQEMVCTRFKAEFPLMEKICVNGSEEHPLQVLEERRQGSFGNHCHQVELHLVPGGQGRPRGGALFPWDICRGHREEAAATSGSGEGGRDGEELTVIVDVSRVLFFFFLTAPPGSIVIDVEPVGGLQ
eukprot:gene12883-biopygen9431